MNESFSIQQSIVDLRSSIFEAQASFDDEFEYNEFAWNIEICFLKLIAITDAMGLIEIGKIIANEYSVIKNSRSNFIATERDENGERYSKHLSKIKQFFRVIEIFFPEDHKMKTIIDLLQIIRNIHYTITDETIFGSVPENEEHVHRRIESILKPIYPDLKHKPTLTKPIKNFEPDTGIPSLGTLIEYKFLSEKQNIHKVADQILADTRGYSSKEWERFIYVIYETRPIKPERDWNDLLRESNVPKNTIIVVLTGVLTK